MPTEPGHFERLESYLPANLLELRSGLTALTVLFCVIMLRYFALVALFYFPIWRWKTASFEPVHDHKLPAGQIAEEIRWSVNSSAIFALAGYAMGILWQQGFSQIYLSFNHLSYWYLPVSFLLLSLLHEVYFYFTHIWMHRPRIFRAIHAVHHRSIKVSPWASFSFHPGEAVIQAAFLPLAVLILPVHPVVLIIYLTFMTLTAISNHLGVELIKNRWVLTYFISGGHHGLHHLKYTCNYGLYFRFMDQIMGTEKVPGTFS